MLCGCRRRERTKKHEILIRVLKDHCNLTGWFKLVLSPTWQNNPHGIDETKRRDAKQSLWVLDSVAVTPQIHTSIHILLKKTIALNLNLAFAGNVQSSELASVWRESKPLRWHVASGKPQNETSRSDKNNWLGEASNEKQHDRYVFASVFTSQTGILWAS